MRTISSVRVTEAGRPHWSPAALRAWRQILWPRLTLADPPAARTVVAGEAAQDEWLGCPSRAAGEPAYPSIILSPAVTCGPQEFQPCSASDFGSA
jgi:hypothetical protein